MGTSNNIYNRVKPAFDKLGITLEPMEGTSMASFEWGHMTHFLFTEDKSSEYAFATWVVDTSGCMLSKEILDDVIEIVKEHYPYTDYIWHDEVPVFVSPAYQPTGNDNLTVENLSSELDRHLEAFHFMQLNLFMMTDDSFQQFR